MSNPLLENIPVYAGAALGSAFTAAFVRGVSGGPTAFDCNAAVLDGLQTGAAFVAYPIGKEILQRTSTCYQRKIKEKRCTALESAIAGSAVLTVLNYPVLKIQELQQTGTVTLQARATLDSFVDNILPLVGFPVTLDFLEAKLPTSTNSLLAWGRTQAILAISGLGATIAQAPLTLIRGKSLAGELRGWVAGLGAGVVLNDAAGHFTKLLS
jgi:hypothetical protein